MSEDTIMMNEEDRAMLKRIEQSTKRTEQAVFGDEDIGLPGLVNDMRKTKEFERNLTIKAVGVSAAITATIIGAKSALAKLFGGNG